MEPKPYKDKMSVIIAKAKAMKQAGIENTGWVPSCDDLSCKVCKKKKSEKAPWNA